MNEENENVIPETPETGALAEAAGPATSEAAPAEPSPTDADGNRWAGGKHAARIVELEGETSQLRDQLLRAMAETENVRKRAERQIEDAHRYAVTGFARDILSIGDNLERALFAVPEERRGEHELLQTLLEGVIAVQNDFQAALVAHKIERLDPTGEPFDPNLHEAMYEVPDSEYPNGSVAQVMQAGYRLHDRLLRPARVGVAKSAVPPTAAAPAADPAATPGADPES
ncbi:MAG: nucleotide exchange factor GrpE [Rhodospirillaceae bacterium]|jgi:molecular chaperone GrpE|nr:nucleotide exchange factor GrpE [Rhodospirillaceae bacterium]MBT5769789.1 nucleotide exchange factor GrpE [Rhodospirillaceae bacterium]MBT6310121.1 nucleotide exchange factor GrpE [Rhodospirillaceae bacterium]MBT7364872.1 nucleotide exchange factor GrpE [Rhodospirillaceae bacterium]